MKSRLITVLFALLAIAPAAQAIPQSFQGNGFFGPVIPAQPRFGANLTEDFLDLANWKKNKFPGPWEHEPALNGQVTRRMTANPILFGAVPDSVVAHGAKDQLRHISVTYLDAGTFFGFKFGGEKSHKDRRAGEKKRSEFDHHFLKLERNLRSRLEKGCGLGTQGVDRWIGVR